MRRAILITCMTSVLFGVVPEEPLEELVPPDMNQPVVGEIAAFDPSILRQPVSFSETQPPNFIPRHKSSFVTVGLSTLCPGLGHVYLGDMKTASGIMGSASTGIGVASFSGHNGVLMRSALVTVSSTWSYGIYAAYRDVRAYNGSSGYSYKMPTDSFADLASASFKLSVLKKPEVWGGLFCELALATAITYFANFPKHSYVASSYRRTRFPFDAFPVGLGEEALFRGYLQSQLIEIFNPAVGITLTSLIFGAAHIPNAFAYSSEARRSYYSFSIPFITAAGAYYGWVTYKNGSLMESVALHSWYDFTLFAISALANQSAATGRPGFSFALSF